MTRKDFQIGVSVLEKGEVLKAVYAHNISPSTSGAAELTRRLTKQDEPTAITMGCALTDKTQIWSCCMYMFSMRAHGFRRAFPLM